MSGYKSRITTINALLAGSSLYLSNQNDIQNCIDEFSKVINCATIKNKQRKDILQILHSSRATDGFLKTFVYANGCYSATKAPHSMGQYLHCLANHASLSGGKLPMPRKSHFQSAVVDIRNSYLHKPNYYPVTPSSTVQNLLNEMHSCVAEVIAI